MTDCRTITRLRQELALPNPTRSTIASRRLKELRAAILSDHNRTKSLIEQCRDNAIFLGVISSVDEKETPTSNND
ncbi:hypothetical protein ACLBXO_31255 [Methylobacterium sp. C33D]